MRQAFDPHASDARLGEVLDEMVGDRADLPVRPARGHDHGVGDRGLAGEIDGDGVLGLQGIDSGED